MRRRPVSTVVLMPSGFLYAPTDRRAVRDGMRALARRARIGDPTTFERAVEHIAARASASAELRRTDPALAALVQLASSPLPALEAADAEPLEPRAEIMPSGWPPEWPTSESADRPRIDRPDMSSPLDGARDAGRRTERRRAEAREAARAAQHERGEEALAVLAALVPPLPSRPAPRRTRRALVASTHPRGRGLFTVNVPGRTVVDRHARRVRGVEVGPDGTLICAPCAAR